MKLNALLNRSTIYQHISMNMRPSLKLMTLLNLNNCLQTFESTYASSLMILITELIIQRSFMAVHDVFKVVDKILGIIHLHAQRRL